MFWRGFLANFKYFVELLKAKTSKEIISARLVVEKIFLCLMEQNLKMNVHIETKAGFSNLGFLKLYFEVTKSLQ